jgi:hypothetical protein
MLCLEFLEQSGLERLGSDTRRELVLSGFDVCSGAHDFVIGRMFGC